MRQQITKILFMNGYSFIGYCNITVNRKSEFVILTKMTKINGRKHLYRVSYHFNEIKQIWVNDKEVHLWK